MKRNDVTKICRLNKSLGFSTLVYTRKLKIISKRKILARSMRFMLKREIHYLAPLSIWCTREELSRSLYLFQRDTNIRGISVREETHCIVHFSKESIRKHNSEKGTACIVSIE